MQDINKRLQIVDVAHIKQQILKYMKNVRAGRQNVNMLHANITFLIVVLDGCETSANISL